MKKLFIIICAVFIAGISFAAEEGSLYVGLDYMVVKSEYNISSKATGAELLDEEMDIDALRARFGYYFLPNFAVEGMVGVGVEDGEYLIFDAELDYMLGIFLLGEYPATDYLNLYTVAGFSMLEATFSGFGEDITENETGFSLSIGLEIKPSKNLGITIEYSELLDDFGGVDEADDFGLDYDYDMSSISLGIKYYF